MPESFRVQRVEKEVFQIVGTFIVKNVQSWVEGLVTVTHCKLSKDLKHGRVFVSVMGGTSKEVIEFLNSNAKEVQRDISKNLRMKYVPKLRFELDEGFNNSLHVQSVLEKLNAEKKNTGVSEDDKKAAT